jgi:glutamate/tyrosine decarboxylase-like PLP-dependent enzyme
MIRLLGRRGIAEMVSRHCALAQRMAGALVAAGAEVLNDVVLNQVAVHFGSDSETQATIAKVQADGVCFVGGAHWRGRQIMRVSVTNENTTEVDIDRSAAAMLAAWRAVQAGSTSAG